MMSELLTASITVALGFLVFVLGQFIQRLCIEPIQEQKRIIGEIGRLAGELRSTLRLVLGYQFFELLRLVEKRDNVMRATTELKEVSLSIRMNDNPAARRHMSAVIQALNIPQEPPGHGGAGEGVPRPS